MGNATGGGSGPTGSAALRPNTFLVYGYLGAAIVVTVTLVRTLGIVTGAVLGIGGHVLFHLPLFVVRSEETLVTDKSVETVRQELSSTRNPLTALWIAKADSVHQQVDRDVPRTECTIPGPLGLTRRRYVLTVDERADGTLHLEIRRDGSAVVDARLAIDGGDPDTRLTVVAERNEVHLFSLVLLRASESTIARYLEERGYEIVAADTSTTFRSFGSGH